MKQLFLKLLRVSVHKWLWMLLAVMFCAAKKNVDFYQFLCDDFERFVSGSEHSTKRRNGVFR